MTPMLWALAGLLWLMCSVLTYGLLMGFSNHRWPHMSYGWRRLDAVYYGLVSLMGPYGLLVALLLCRPYALAFKSLTRQESKLAWEYRFGKWLPYED